MFLYYMFYIILYFQFWYYRVKKIKSIYKLENINIKYFVIPKECIIFAHRKSNIKKIGYHYEEKGHEVLQGFG